MVSSALQEQIGQVRQDALATLEKVTGPKELESFRVEFLGRSRGRLRDLTAGIKELDAAERRAAGQQLNALKGEIQKALAARRRELDAGGEGSGPRLDLTQPAPRLGSGHIHPLTRTMESLKEVFGSLGFSCVEGPEIETEAHNFDALNIPADHPARDSFDTFFLDAGGLLRSHTSPTQIRVMEAGPPPVRVIVPGRVYRPDAVDATHHYCFHQCEGLMVDEDVSFSDLKAVLSLAMEGIFGPGTRTRFRPSFFPFTEPSAEVDVSCPFCGGEGCSVCKKTGWIELLGAGMVDPAVFEAVGYDPERYTGFAFGIGVERLAMLKYGISDIRLFTENDMRFLEQF